MSRRLNIVKCSILILLTAATVCAQTTSVSVSPTTRNALPLSTINLSFTISNVTNLHLYHVVVTFDNTVLQYTGTLVGTFFIDPIFFFTLPAPSPSVTSVTVDQALQGSEVRSGSGVLFTMNFIAAATGTSPVTLDVTLRDGLNNTIGPVTINGGSVTVGYPHIVYVDPTYTPASAGGHEFGYDAFTGIGPGVSAVNAGGRVEIAPATYSETVSVEKNITLTGISNPTIHNLTVNTPAVTIGGNIQIRGTLTLTSGVVTTGPNKIIISNDQPGGVVITDGSIAGEICRTIAAGDTREYLFTNRFSMLKPGPSQPAATMCFVSYPGVYPPNAVTGNAISRHYLITPSVPGFLADVLALEYLPSENVHNIPALSMRLFRNANHSWYNMLGNAENMFGHTFVRSFVIDAWSVWTVGNADDPLPVQLALFTGVKLPGRGVRLDWRTLTEVNNYGFFVQRKRQTDSLWADVQNSFVPGHGTTLEPHDYLFIDTTVRRGDHSYRLRQVDLNGTQHFSETINVNVVTAVGEELPRVFALHQNYPNPFNPTTTIRFQIPNYGHVSLKVFDMLGREVATLVSEKRDAGFHDVVFDAYNLASGVYLCRLQAGDYDSTKKFMLLR